MKPAPGQRVLYKSKGNVYDYPAGTLVPAVIDSLVLRPGSNITLPKNPVNLKIMPEDAEYTFAIMHVLHGDGLGEWTEMEEAENEGATRSLDPMPADRLEQIVHTLKKHGIHVDPMDQDEPQANAAAPQDRIEGSPVPKADPEAAARVSAAKDEEIAKLRDKVTEEKKAAGDLKRDNQSLKAKIDAVTKENEELVKQRDAAQANLEKADNSTKAVVQGSEATAQGNAVDAAKANQQPISNETKAATGNKPGNTPKK